jgi:hypothetical protein
VDSPHPIHQDPGPSSSSLFPSSTLLTSLAAHRSSVMTLPLPTPSVSRPPLRRRPATVSSSRSTRSVPSPSRSVLLSSRSPTAGVSWFPTGPVRLRSAFSFPRFPSLSSSFIDFPFSRFTARPLLTSSSLSVLERSRPVLPAVPSVLPRCVFLSFLAFLETALTLLPPSVQPSPPHRRRACAGWPGGHLCRCQRSLSRSQRRPSFQEVKRVVVVC